MEKNEYNLSSVTNYNSILFYHNLVKIMSLLIISCVVLILTMASFINIWEGNKKNICLWPNSEGGEYRLNERVGEDAGQDEVVGVF